MNRRRPQAAAIFDLDRTLIAGPSGPAFAAPPRRGRHPPALAARRRPRAATYQALGETAITAPTARLAARATAGWPVDAVRAAAEAAADELDGEGPAVRPGRDGRAPRGRAGAGDGDDQPGAARHAVRRAARVRRRRRHAVGAEDGAYTGERRRTARVGPGQAGGRPGVGRRRGRRPAPLVGLQRQLLRRPAARRRRAPDRRQRRPPARRAWPGCKGWPLRHFDLPEGVLKIAGRELQEWTRPLQRPELLANVRLDIAGVENIPTTGPVIAVFNHRSYFDATVVGDRPRPDRALVPLPRQEGGLRRPGHRVLLEDGRRHPGQPLVGIERAAGARHPRPRGRRGRGAGARGHDPARAGVLRARAEGALGRRPPGRRPPTPRSSRSGCGAPRWCGRATAACPASTSPSARRSACASATGRR